MLFDLSPEELSAYATAAAVVVAVVALLVALRQVVVTRREARRSTAHGIYKDYLTLAFQNPKFSSASYPKSAPLLHTFSKDPLEYEKYEFYVSHVLFATEGILDACADTEWVNTLTDQLRYHALYLQNTDLHEGHYSSRVLALCESAIHTYNSESDDA